MSHWDLRCGSYQTHQPLLVAQSTPTYCWINRENLTILFPSNWEDTDWLLIEVVGKSLICMRDNVLQGGKDTQVCRNFPRVNAVSAKLLFHPANGHCLHGVRSVRTPLLHCTLSSGNAGQIFRLHHHGCHLLLRGNSNTSNASNLRRQ